MPEQPPDRFSELLRNHHGHEGVDLAALEHHLQRRVGWDGLQPDPVGWLDGADWLAGHPHDVVRRYAVLVGEKSANPDRSGHLIVADTYALALQLLRPLNIGVGAHVDSRMAKNPRRKDRDGAESRVTFRAQDRVGRERHLGRVELSVIEHAPEGLAGTERKERQVHALGLHPAVNERLGTIIAAAGQRQFEVAHDAGITFGWRSEAGDLFRAHGRTPMDCRRASPDWASIQSRARRLVHPNFL